MVGWRNGNMPFAEEGSIPFPADNPFNMVSNKQSIQSKMLVRC